MCVFCRMGIMFNCLGEVLGLFLGGGGVWCFIV